MVMVRKKFSRKFTKNLLISVFLKNNIYIYYMNYKNYSLSKILYGGSALYPRVVPNLGPRIEQIIKQIHEERAKLIECNRKIAQIEDIKDESNALRHKRPNSQTGGGSSSIENKRFHFFDAMLGREKDKLEECNKKLALLTGKRQKILEGGSATGPSIESITRGLLQQVKKCNEEKKHLQDLIDFKIFSNPDIPENLFMEIFHAGDKQDPDEKLARMFFKAENLIMKIQGGEIEGVSSTQLDNLVKLRNKLQLRAEA